MNSTTPSHITEMITRLEEVSLSKSDDLQLVDWATALSPLFAAILAVVGVGLTAHFTLRKGFLDARFRYASTILEYRIKQINEFYAPMLVHVEKSRRLYEKLLHLLETRESDFNRSNFRLLDHIHRLSNDDDYKSAVDAIIATGSQMSELIIKKSALIEGGVTKTFIDYTAHFEILKAAKTQSPPESTKHGWHKQGYYTRLLNREIA